MYRVPISVLRLLKGQMDSIEHAKRGHAMVSEPFYDSISRRQADVWREVRSAAGMPDREEMPDIKIDWSTGEVTELPRKK